MVADRPPRFGSVVPVSSRATLLDRGVTAKQLRGPSWQRVGPARYLPAGVQPDGPAQRIVVAASCAPDGAAVAGWAAAWALGVDQCDGLATDGRTELDLPVCIGPKHLTAVPSGYALWFDRLPPEDVVEVEGLAVTAARRTCFDGMRRADDVVEAVVFADQMLHAGLVTIPGMRAYAGQHAGWRGVPQVRQALELADPRARNAWETRMRMVWMLDAGLPRPLCNPPVFDLYGCLLGFPDLLDSEAGTVGEFDGAGHRELGQHTDDNAREERFENHRLVVMRATSVDIGRRGPLASRMRQARGRGLARDRSRDLWTLEIPPDWGPYGAEDELDTMLDGSGRHRT